MAAVGRKVARLGSKEGTREKDEMYRVREESHKRTYTKPEKQSGSRQGEQYIVSCTRGTNVGGLV